MSLGSGTPVTSWPIEPTSSELVDGFNRIGGNTQDLEDSKVENASDGSTEVDLSQGSDSDVSVEVASDASISWDESADEFVVSKDVSALVEITDTPEQVKGTTIAAGATWTPPAGMYQIIFDAPSLSPSVFCDVFVSGAWRARDISPSGGSGGASSWFEALVTDGTNVRIRNASAVTITAHYLRF